MKEVAAMPQSSSDGQQGAVGYVSLSSLPLPWPAVVIDMRHPAPQDRPVVWNMATEIEDLTAKIGLHRVNRWRYLQQWIEFITLGPLPPGETVNTANSFTLINGANKAETFSTKERLMEHIHRECIDRVRTNRNSAARDTDRLIEVGEESMSGREQSTVRVFFLIDIADPNAFNSAATYATILRQKSYQYDDPRRSGRDEPISPIAICMSADKIHPEQAPRQPLLQLTEDIVAPAFDMLILVHAYDDSQGFINRQAQLYELELILHAMLLAPDDLLMGKQEMRDEDAHHYLTVIQQIEEENSAATPVETSKPDRATAPSPVSPILCMIGASSFEYSARWGTRWIDYGLVKEVLGALCIQQKEILRDSLRLPDGRDWLDDWWADVKRVVPRSLASSVQEFNTLTAFQRHITTSPFQGVSLPHSNKALTNFCEQTKSYYGSGPYGITLQQALNSTEQILPLLKNAMNSHLQSNFQPLPYNDEEMKALVYLQLRASRFSIALFRGATRAFSNAINQISELEERVGREEIGQLARTTPNLAQRLATFEHEAWKTQRRLQQLIKTWKLPLLGEVQRPTCLSILLALLVVLFAWLLQNNFKGLPGTASLFSGLPGLSPFILSCFIIVAVVVLLFLSLHDKQLHQERESISTQLRALASQHLHEVQSSIAAKTALILLREAGLYHSEGKVGVYKSRLRLLQNALIEAQRRALYEQKAAYERLKPIWSQTQIDSTSSRIWLNLNSRKDLLQWEEIVEIFQRLKKTYTIDNLDLDRLAEYLLKYLGNEEHLESSMYENETLPFMGQKSRQEQLQQIGTKLVAVLLAAESTGASITKLHPLLERYISLENSSPNSSSALGRHIADLYNLVKADLLEQAMSSSLDKTSEFSSFDEFEAKRGKTIEQLVAAWIEHLRSDDEETLTILNQDSIMTRLSELKIKPFNALEDLRKRCRLLGLPRETFESNHSYILLAPDPFSDSLLEALAALQPIQLSLVPFPDQEKLIYLHMYRARLTADDNLFLT